MQTSQVGCVARFVIPVSAE